MKVLHLITDLDVGGAEMMLLYLLKQPSFIQNTCRVVSLTSMGTIGLRIRDLGVDVVSLEMKPKYPQVQCLRKIIQILRDDPPDLIQSWMYHADFLGSLAVIFSRKIPIVWGLHHSLEGMAPVKKRTMNILRMNALLSHWLPRSIICCSEATRKSHIRVGYQPRKLVVVPNGVDLNEFSHQRGARAEVRKELGIDEDTPLIGIFARFHPQKDHETFIQAASIMHHSNSKAHFLLAGAGITPENKELSAWVQAAGIQHQAHLLGIRFDIPRLLSAVDVTCLSSAYGEALPISIIESMACGTPCVVTDIGDSSLVVGDTGKVVPPRNPLLLSQAWQEMMTLQENEKKSLSRRVREKIADEYNIKHTSEHYLALYHLILNPGETHG